MSGNERCVTCGHDADSHEHTFHDGYTLIGDCRVFDCHCGGFVVAPTPEPVTEREDAPVSDHRRKFFDALRAISFQWNVPDGVFRAARIHAASWAGDEYRARDAEIAQLRAEVGRLRAAEVEYIQALAKIEAWELPMLNDVVPEYEAHWGSNGARDYMRNVAAFVLRRERPHWLPLNIRAELEATDATRAEKEQGNE